MPAPPAIPKEGEHHRSAPETCHHDARHQAFVGGEPPHAGGQGTRVTEPCSPRPPGCRCPGARQGSGLGTRTLSHIRARRGCHPCSPRASLPRASTFGEVWPRTASPGEGGDGDTEHELSLSHAHVEGTRGQAGFERAPGVDAAQTELDDKEASKFRCYARALFDYDLCFLKSVSGIIHIAGEL